MNESGQDQAEYEHAVYSAYEAWEYAFGTGLTFEEFADVSIGIVQVFRAAQKTTQRQTLEVMRTKS